MLLYSALRLLRLVDADDRSWFPRMLRTESEITPNWLRLNGSGKSCESQIQKGRLDALLDEILLYVKASLQEQESLVLEVGRTSHP